MENLRRRSVAEPWSHAKNAPDGRLICVALMQQEAIGPSRLLLPYPFKEVFSEGYEVALPEISCAFAVSMAIKSDEKSGILDMIEDCYNHGSRPLVQGLHPAEMLYSCGDLKG
jgi:hypothetical protein